MIENAYSTASSVISTSELASLDSYQLSDGKTNDWAAQKLKITLDLPVHEITVRSLVIFNKSSYALL